MYPRRSSTFDYFKLPDPLPNTKTLISSNIPSVRNNKGGLVDEFKQEVPIPNSEAPPDVIKAFKSIIKNLDNPNTTVAGIKEHSGFKERDSYLTLLGIPTLRPGIL